MENCSAFDLAPWMVPKVWVWAKIGDICDIIGGSTPDTKVVDNFADGEISWITPADLSGYEGKYISRGARNITAKGLQGCSAKVMKAGTVLFSSRAPIGYVAIAAKPLATNQGFKSFVPPNGILSDYLYYYLKHAKKLAIQLSSGTTFREISAQKAALIPFPLPPFSEQHRIVAKIEELFSELDKGVENLKAAQQQLKVYRQAVLQWAFEGKMTECVPLKSIVAELFDGPFGSNLKTSDYTDFGIRVIRLENIKNLKFNDNSKSFVSKDKYETIKRNTVYSADIVMSTFISNDVKICQIPKNVSYAINKADCICIRPENVMVPLFLMYYLSSRHVYLFLSLKIHGATRPRVNTTQIKQIPVPICSIQEQKAIVQEIESRLSVCDKMEETINQSLAQADVLRQSILNKAFAGKLVPQDPNDESADKLLARIRTERETQQPETKQAKGRTKK
ncbi:MAG: Type restriction-modification system, specificity subunit [Firmicutes bacterium]|nr:Type restriction-modification system, specificity subunit [Bacillota bacterium]